MELPGWMELSVFSALILTASVFVVVSSGHFPARDRTVALKTISGSMLIWCSIFILLLSTILGLYVGYRLVPWYAAIIGGGLMVLIAPLIAQSLSDAFVDGKSALVVLIAIALALDFTALQLIV